ncbi:hypothetical protein MMC07_005697 [Pseudocyphellaria aurata]|nr:hypothetical protein [Pseudocyphellaria aurata]
MADTHGFLRFLHAATVIKVLCLVATLLQGIDERVALSRLAGLSHFFNRDFEQRALEALLKNPPTASGIVLLLGPRSSGKSALLQQLFTSEQVDKESLGAAASNAWLCNYLDGRMGKFTGPANLARQLKSASTSLSQRIQKTGFTFDFGWFKAVLQTQPNISELEQIIGAFSDNLKAFAAKRSESAGVSFPIICLDQANNLRSWQDGPDSWKCDLQALLDFFTAVCPIAVLAEARFVLLAPERFVLKICALQVTKQEDWTGIDAKFVTVAVLGNLLEEEAQEYFEKHALPSADWNYFETLQVAAKHVLRGLASLKMSSHVHGLNVCLFHVLRSPAEILAICCVPPAALAYPLSKVLAPLSIFADALKEGRWEQFHHEILSIQGIQGLSGVQLAIVDDNAAVLEDVYCPIMRLAEAAFNETGFPWERDQYRALARALVENPYHALPLPEARAKLKVEEVESLLNSMTEKNFLAYRPQSRMPTICLHTYLVMKCGMLSIKL